MKQGPQSLELESRRTGEHPNSLATNVMTTTIFKLACLKWAWWNDYCNGTDGQTGVSTKDTIICLILLRSVINLNGFAPLQTSLISLVILGAPQILWATAFSRESVIIHTSTLVVLVWTKLNLQSLPVSVLKLWRNWLGLIAVSGVVDPSRLLLAISTSSTVIGCVWNLPAQFCRLQLQLRLRPGPGVWSGLAWHGVGGGREETGGLGLLRPRSRLGDSNMAVMWATW